MTVEEQVVQMVQQRPNLIRSMLGEFCPAKFGIVNNFVKVNRFACTEGCEGCWNRTEEEVKRDEEIWIDYKKTDFNKVDYNEWLKKWKID